MKAILTLVYEKEIDSDERDGFQESVDDYDEQLLSEAFGIGYDCPKSTKIEFVEQ